MAASAAGGVFSAARTSTAALLREMGQATKGAAGELAEHARLNGENAGRVTQAVRNTAQRLANVEGHEKIIGGATFAAALAATTLPLAGAVHLGNKTREKYTDEIATKVAAKQGGGHGNGGDDGKTIIIK